jgi:hypothetical protein
VQNNELAAMQKHSTLNRGRSVMPLSFSKNENPSKKYTAVTRIQQSAESSMTSIVTRFCYARPSTLGEQK